MIANISWMGPPTSWRQIASYLAEDQLKIDYLSRVQNKAQHALRWFWTHLHFDQKRRRSLSSKLRNRILASDSSISETGWQWRPTDMERNIGWRRQLRDPLRHGPSRCFRSCFLLSRMDSLNYSWKRIALNISPLNSTCYISKELPEKCIQLLLNRQSKSISRLHKRRIETKSR